MQRLWLRRWMLGAGAALAMCSGAQAAPDFSGYWQIDRPVTQLRTADGKTPPLLPAAQTEYNQHLQARSRGDTAFDTTNRCLPPGVPRLMMLPSPFEIVQRPGFLIMLFQYQHLNRQIFLADQHTHSALGRRFLGDSIAGWDGDTLVVDTTGFKDDTLLDDSGLPHSRELHVVERYWLLGSGRLEARVRIEDAKTYAEPWETTLRFRRLRNVQFKEDVCTDRHPEWLQETEQENR